MAKINIDTEKCKACGYCIEFCKDKLIIMSDKKNKKGFNFVIFEDNGNKCKGCKFCAIMCPEAAIEIFEGTDKDE
jgi:2-oxoglutarate ferredoxin oxidoreductase subunit delta